MIPNDVSYDVIAASISAIAASIALFFNFWAISKQTKSNDFQAYVYIRQEAHKIISNMEIVKKSCDRNEEINALLDLLQFLDCLAHLRSKKFGDLSHQLARQTIITGLDAMKRKGIAEELRRAISADFEHLKEFIDKNHIEFFDKNQSKI